MADYHWSPALKRAFLETLSETGSVTEACRSVSMSRRAAYNLRHQRAGFAFRVGWDAALLLARDVVADVLMERVLEGQWVETIRDKETGSTRRLSHDRSLSLALLNRLDKHADDLIGGDSFSMAAQMASQDFEAFLALVEQDAGPAEVRDFLYTFSHEWAHGNVAALTEGFEWPELNPDATNRPAPKRRKPRKLRKPCELRQISAIPETTPVSNYVPTPKDPGYYEWLAGPPREWPG